MCEHRETIQKVQYALDLMDGTRVYDIGKLKKLLSQECEHGEKT